MGIIVLGPGNDRQGEGQEAQGKQGRGTHGLLHLNDDQK
jgi:hypothetical protein